MSLLKKYVNRNMSVKSSNIGKPMNRLQFAIILLTTNLSWWLMKKNNTITVLTVYKYHELVY
ncbi:MAG: hypothetical protein U9P73_04505 [Candidatus Cloacimonadota bacterium]|nr:hypothetical protein [Candidatus Cloacimonadota bacterium]